MMRPAASAPAILVAALLALPASASLLESQAGVSYQADAGTHHDAPDTCLEALASPEAFDLPVGGEATGLLVPVDDETDHLRVTVSPDLVGGRLRLAVAGRDLSPSFAIEAFMPACGGLVTDPGNQPSPASHPAPAAGERQVQPHNAGAGACSTRWFLVLNQFAHLAPPSTVHAIWTDGSEADIPLLKATSATTAHYAWGANLAYTLHSVTANVPASWDGQFNVAEQPCGATEGTAVFGPPAVATDTSVEFTPTQAGTYVLGIRYVPPEAPAPGASVPRSCHAFCVFAPDAATGSGGYKATSLFS